MSVEPHGEAGRLGLTAQPQPARSGAGHSLAGLQQQQLEVAIYAGGLRAQLGAGLPAPAAAALRGQIEQAEQLRRALERQVAELERARAPWWRRWR